MGLLLGGSGGGGTSITGVQEFIDTTVWKSNYATQKGYLAGDIVLHAGELYLFTLAVPNTNTAVTPAGVNGAKHLSAVNFLISEIALTLTTLADGDYFAVSDISANGTPNKKITWANIVTTMVAAINALSGNSRLSYTALRDQLTGSNIVTLLAALTGTNRLSYNNLKDRPTIGTNTTLWQGTYATGRAYLAGDIVLYQDSVYLFTEAVADTNTEANPASVTGVKELEGSDFRVAGVTEAVTTLEGSDEFVVSDDSADGKPNKKITWTNIVTSIVAGLAALSGNSRLSYTALKDQLTGANVVTLLSALSGNARLPYSAIRNTPTIPDLHHIHSLTTATPSLPDYIAFSDEDVQGDPNRKATIETILSEVASLDALPAIPAYANSTAYAVGEIVRAYDRIWIVESAVSASNTSPPGANNAFRGISVDNLGRLTYPYSFTSNLRYLGHSWSQVISANVAYHNVSDLGPSGTYASLNPALPAYTQVYVSEANDLIGMNYVRLTEWSEVYTTLNFTDSDIVMTVRMEASQDIELTYTWVAIDYQQWNSAQGTLGTWTTLYSKTTSQSHSIGGDDSFTAQMTRRVNSIQLNRGDFIKFRVGIAFSALTSGVTNLRLSHEDIAIRFDGYRGIRQELTLKEDGSMVFTPLIQGDDVSVIRADGYWENAVLGDDWETLWYNASGLTTQSASATHDLDSGDKFSDWSFLEFEYQDDASDQYKQVRYITTADFVANDITLPSSGSHLGIEYIDDNTFRFRYKYGSCRLHRIRGHK